MIVTVFTIVTSACSDEKKLECGAVFIGCGTICVCDMPACECCIACMACVTATIANCCECLFPQWDKCDDKPKGECVVPYTLSDDVRDWSLCYYTPMTWAPYDRDLSVTYTITSLVGSGDVRCVARGATDMTDCSCEVAYENNGLSPMGTIGVGSTITLMTMGDCGTRSGSPSEVYLRCASSINVPTTLTWSYTFQRATQCCGYGGLRYDSAMQTCCCLNGSCVACPRDICCDARCCDGHGEVCVGNDCRYPYELM